MTLLTRAKISLYLVVGVSLLFLCCFDIKLPLITRYGIRDENHNGYLLGSIQEHYGEGELSHQQTQEFSNGDPVITQGYTNGEQHVSDVHVMEYSIPKVTKTLEEKKNIHSSYLMQYQPDHFVINYSLTLPMPQVTLPIYELIKQQWMADLRKYLYKIPPNAIISIVSSSSSYLNLLLNWLISATIETNPPLSNILVLSIDQSLHEILVRHNITSIYIDFRGLFYPKMVSILQKKHKVAFRIVMVMRLTVMRILNHWGYDVANYDVDAIIINNPEYLYYKVFNSSNVIGSRGKFPEFVRRIFGITLCAGAFMIKSTTGSEQLWNNASMVAPINDQEKLNIALTTMNLTSNTTTDYWMATNNQGFTLTLLQEKHVCRKKCIRKKKNSYYIWHSRGKGNEGKVRAAKIGRLWYLRDDWRQMVESSNAEGVMWLRDIQRKA